MFRQRRTGAPRAFPHTCASRSRVHTPSPMASAPTHKNLPPRVHAYTCEGRTATTPRICMEVRHRNGHDILYVYLSLSADFNYVLYNNLRLQLHAIFTFNFMYGVIRGSEGMQAGGIMRGGFFYSRAAFLYEKRKKKHDLIQHVLHSSCCNFKCLSLRHKSVFFFCCIFNSTI